MFQDRGVSQNPLLGPPDHQCDEVKASITPTGLEASATALKRGRGQGRNDCGVD